MVGRHSVWERCRWAPVDRRRRVVRWSAGAVHGGRRGFIRRRIAPVTGPCLIARKFTGARDWELPQDSTGKWGELFHPEQGGVPSVEWRGMFSGRGLPCGSQGTSAWGVVSAPSRSHGLPRAPLVFTGCRALQLGGSCDTRPPNVRWRLGRSVLPSKVVSTCLGRGAAAVQAPDGAIGSHGRGSGGACLG